MYVPPPSPIDQTTDQVTRNPLQISLRTIESDHNGPAVVIDSDLALPIIDSSWTTTDRFCNLHHYHFSSSLSQTCSLFMSTFILHLEKTSMIGSHSSSLLSFPTSSLINWLYHYQVERARRRSLAWRRSIRNIRHTNRRSDPESYRSQARHCKFIPRTNSPRNHFLVWMLSLISPPSETGIEIECWNT